MDNETLLNRIKDFCRRHNLSGSYVTLKAVGNSRLYGRLQKGGSVRLNTANDLLEWLSAEDQRRRQLAEIATTKEQRKDQAP